MTSYSAYLPLIFKPVDLDAHPNVRVGKAGGYFPGGPLVINPDDYLETESGRVFTLERNHQAWQQAYARLESALAQSVRGAHLYLVMGVQGAGKSSWISNNLDKLGTRAVVFDAALPARRHREQLIGMAARYGVPVMAVFLNTSLELAKLRNNLRGADKRVPASALESVYSLLKSPSEDEGFIGVQIIASR